ncbi:DUF3558 domain-containing protein [Nocardia panacis]|uniref:DUF3558 domain-containing protein n=1 Tax=Nocardia panacis TaxID=2340916 RepID=A0A3A4KJH2_9NOCA|nr:DUF3558 family protein [Nocardia panacis]RJO76804.1 DUF3558 domain-containing protein [Nocardia panacis]
MKISASKYLVTAVTCGAALLLSACNEDVTPTKGTTGATSSTSAQANAPTTAKADGGSAPETTRTDSSGGTPTTKTATPVSDEPWDSCDIPSADISAAGLNPGSKERNKNPNSPAPGCHWLSSDGKYELQINTDDQTIDQIAQSPKVVNVRRTNYYGRQMIVFNARQDGNHIGCLLGLQTSSGSVVFTTRKHGDQAPTLEPCAAVQEFMGKLGNKNLPA